MKANRAYQLIVRRGGFAPAFLAHPDRVDSVEVVEVDSGEVALFWDLPAKAAQELIRSVRRDLVELEERDFIARWERYRA